MCVLQREREYLYNEKSLENRKEKKKTKKALLEEKKGHTPDQSVIIYIYILME